MERLTENDRGTFLVTTQGSTHMWEITDKGVKVTRNSGRANVYGLNRINGTPYDATVEVWPEVGGCFRNVINGGAGDIPWTRSSRIESIERVGGLTDEAVRRIEDMIFIDANRHGTVTIECNYCNKDNYVFSETSDGTEYGWFASALDHFRTHHPEKMP